MSAATTQGDFANTVLRMLTQQSGCATSEQIVRLAQQIGVARRTARDSLNRLHSEGLVTFRRSVVRQVETIKPVRRFTPAETPEDFGRLSSCLCRRWQQAPQAQQLVYRATQKAAGLFGSAVVESVEAHKADHDLVLTEVLLHYLGSDPKPAWFHEANLDSLDLVRSRTKPDAIVWPSRANAPRAIEVGGQYGSQRLKRLHRAMTESDLEWELW